MKLNFKSTAFLVFTTIGICNVSQAQFTGTNPIQQASAGNVLIGYPNYANGTSMLQVRNGAVTFDGTTGATPVSGAGTRLMWIPAKGAFRAGKVTGTQWDNANIGYQSFACGQDNQAISNYSFAAGSGNTVNCNSGGVAFGASNNVSGIHGFASGQTNTITSYYGVALGRNLNVNSYHQVSIGLNSLDLGGNYGAYVDTDPLFVVGNGQSTTARSNALTMLKNGNTGFGISNPTDKVSINGTLRMNFNAIYLAGDAFHGIGYYDVYTGSGNYAGYHVDGPVVFGYTGGALGTSQFNGVKNIALSWLANGNVGIGTTNPGSYRLAIEGKAGAREFVITNASWADFVFEDSYKLKSLKEVETFLKENKRLPEIPSAKEIETNGLSLGELQAKQMQKIEELTLYIIELNKRIEELEKK